MFKLVSELYICSGVLNRHGLDTFEFAVVTDERYKNSPINDLTRGKVTSDQVLRFIWSHYNFVVSNEKKPFVYLWLDLRLNRVYIVRCELSDDSVRISETLVSRSDMRCDNINCLCRSN